MYKDKHKRQRTVSILTAYNDSIMFIYLKRTWNHVPLTGLFTHHGLLRQGGFYVQFENIKENEHFAPYILQT